jgi:hypothetical protein
VEEVVVLAAKVMDLAEVVALVGVVMEATPAFLLNLEL